MEKYVLPALKLCNRKITPSDQNTSKSYTYADQLTTVYEHFTINRGPLCCQLRVLLTKVIATQKTNPVDVLKRTFV